RNRFHRTLHFENARILVLLVTKPKRKRERERKRIPLKGIPFSITVTKMNECSMKNELNAHSYDGNLQSGILHPLVGLRKVLYKRHTQYYSNQNLVQLKHNLYMIRESSKKFQFQFFPFWP